MAVMVWHVTQLQEADLEGGLSVWQHLHLF